MKAKVNFDGQWLPDINFTPASVPQNDRVKKSLKTFFVFFGLAVFCVFIPVLHFFLTPLFLVLSVYLSIRKYKEIYSADFSTLKCPSCLKIISENKVPLRADDVYVRLHCKDCQKTLTLVIEDN